MGLFDVAIDQIASHGEAASADMTLLYHETMATVFGFDVPNDPPPSQATDANFFTVDGIYIYLTYGMPALPLWPGHQLTFCFTRRSQLYSSDMFHTVFSRDPMSCTQGLLYRKMVLKKGSSEDEMEFLQAFLGRRPSIDALRTELEKGWDFLRLAELHQQV